MRLSRLGVSRWSPPAARQRPRGRGCGGHPPRRTLWQRLVRAPRRPEHRDACRDPRARLQRLAPGRNENPVPPIACRKTTLPSGDHRGADRRAERGGNRGHMRGHALCRDRRRHGTRHGAGDRAPAWPDGAVSGRAARRRHDANRAGERYGARHAELAAAAGIAFERLAPPAGNDWNDVLVQRRPT
jgi:hypothetical protein